MRNRRLFVYVAVTVAFWVAVVVLRGTAPNDLSPWELPWILWVLAMSFSGACVGFAVGVAWCRRRSGG
jgi:hypothetical protein